jgi:hypothetical protein
VDGDLQTLAGLRDQGQAGSNAAASEIRAKLDPIGFGALSGDRVVD